MEIEHGVSEIEWVHLESGGLVNYAQRTVPLTIPFQLNLGGDPFFKVNLRG